jgi:hypothetical protein
MGLWEDNQDPPPKVKSKVKSSLRLTKRHALNTYCGAEV